ncbi:hypothetical protein CL614_01540 [archaeon]|nr:hypothetical protein [archaeon]|tara:strand:- start:1074 stop:1949 length:876 start_codon:yes stop_codon:yes gene_type:complete
MKLFKKEEKASKVKAKKKKFLKKKKVIDFSNVRDVTMLSVSTAVIIVVLNVALITNNQIFAVINLVAGLIAFGIPVSVSYKSHSSNKRIEEVFPVFLRDINSNIKVGMSLPQAIRETTNNDYGVLTSHVKDISAKIDWGISFEKVLQDFVDKVKSPVLSKIIKTVIETHSSGGEIGQVLETVSKSVESIEKIKKERSSTIYSQMVNGYFIYFIFLGIMVVMSNFLFPAINLSSGDVAGTNFNTLFLHLIVIEGIFAGLAIGKMSEASFIAGAKHSIVLATIGYASFALFVL